MRLPRYSELVCPVSIEVEARRNAPAPNATQAPYPSVVHSASYRTLLTVEAIFLAIALVAALMIPARDPATSGIIWLGGVLTAILVAVAGRSWEPFRMPAFVAVNIGLIAVVGVDLALEGGSWSPIWPLLFVPLLFVVASPLRRWTVGFAVLASVALVLASLAAEATGTAYETGLGPGRLIIQVALLVGIAALGRGFGDVFWQRVEDAAVLHVRLTNTNAEAGAFVATVARELRAPLASVKGYAETLLLPGAEWDAADETEFLETIDAEAGTLATVVDDLLEMSRIDRGLIDLDLGAVHMARLAESAARRAGVEVDLVADADVPIVTADRRRLERAIVVLLEHAAADAPGPVRCRLDEIRTRRWNRRLGDHREIVLAVATLDEAEVPEPADDVRLGIAKGLIEAHHGHLVTGPDGFELHIPVTSTSPEPGSEPDSDAATPAQLFLSRTYRWGIALYVVIGIALLLPDSRPEILWVPLVALAWELLEWVAEWKWPRRGIRIVGFLGVIWLGAAIAVTGGIQSPLWPLVVLWVGAAALWYGPVATKLTGIAAAAVLAVSFAIADWPAGWPVYSLIVPLAFPIAAAHLLGGLKVDLGMLGDRIDALNERLEALGHEAQAFLAMVSHELRTPLASVKGYAESLLLPGAEWDAATRREFLEAIGAESEKLTRLVDDLGEVSRLDAGRLRVEPEPVLMTRIAAVVAERFANREPQRPLEVSADPDVPIVIGDPRRIEEILSNLLDNAWKYAPAGTRVEIRVRGAGDEVVVEVVDHGPGVDPRVASRLFDRFVRGPDATTSGTGLGLAICRGLVEAHGGDMAFVETPGGGATFRFSLPAEPAAASMAAAR